jgi:hypothetical protein
MNNAVKKFFPEVHAQVMGLVLEYDWCLNQMKG